MESNRSPLRTWFVEWFAAGMLLHLESAFFARQTLHSLVYSAPLFANLAILSALGLWHELERA